MNQRVSRVLLGLAIGDAYGVGFEFKTQKEIQHVFSSKVLKSLGGGPFNFLPGEFSDDTEMALLTLYSLMHYQDLNVAHIKQLYTVWAHFAKDIGVQTQKALFNNEINHEAQGNGALMRIIPTVVYMHDVLGWDNTTIKHAIHSISIITHDVPIIHQVNDFFIDLVLEKEIEKHKAIMDNFLQTTGNSGWVMNTARIVYVTFLKTHLSLLDGMWEIISYGGDTDTACAIYATLRICHDEKLLEVLHVDDFLNQESQLVLHTFNTTCLHYYQPDPIKYPHLYAGQYPGSKQIIFHVIKLSHLVDLGIECVVSLMEESESKRFTPYQNALLHIKHGIEFFQFPIKDMNIPSKSFCHTIMQTLEQLLTCKKKVYIHCWGGHGRTGVVVGSWLVLQGYHPKEALAQIKMQRMGTPFLNQSSPQTDEQIRFVYNVFKKDSKE